MSPVLTMKQFYTFSTTNPGLVANWSALLSKHMESAGAVFVPVRRFDATVVGRCRQCPVVAIELFNQTFNGENYLQQIAIFLSS